MLTEIRVVRQDTILSIAPCARSCLTVYVCYVSRVQSRNAPKLPVTGRKTRRGRLRLVLTFALSALSMFVAFTSRVQARASDHVSLDYQASDDCSGARHILRAIDRQLGESFESDTQLRATVELHAHGPSDYELVVDYSSSSAAADHRVIHAESCEAAADAAALLLGLALVPKPPGDTATASSAAALSHNELGVIGALDTAVMHRTTVGAGLLLALRFGAWRISLNAVQWLRQQIARDAVQVDIEYLSVALGACYLASLTILEAGPCLNLEIGRLGGFASGVDGARPDGARVQALALAAHVRLHVFAPLWLMVEPSVEWLERRPRFIVDEIGQLHQPAVWGMRVVFGPVFKW